jgi:isocitrate lyase
VKRPYTAAQVVAKRGTLPIAYPSDVLGKKLWRLLSEHAKRGTPSHTYGACVHLLSCLCAARTRLLIDSAL